MISYLRSRGGSATALGAGVLVAGAVIAWAAFPVAAAAAGALVTSVSCSVTGSNWCISGNNSSSGIGVIGTSKTGTGLRGTSTSQNGLKATSGSGDGILAQSTSGDAIVAQTTSGASAIIATAGSNGYGVNASGGVVGVYGVSPSNYGVYGATTAGGGYGVLGSVSGAGIGTYGGSSSGFGIEGYSSSGTAGSFSSTNGYGVVANTGGEVAVYGNNTNGNGADLRGSYIGVVGRAPSTGFPFVATDPSGNNLFYVDGSGNVSYKGGLYHITAVSGGALARSFSADSTQPTVEDTGTAQLVDGAAVVRLDPTFAASIDRTTAYRVFVTPGGDTRGLYVTSKSPGAFVVRESQAGRSTVAFDYRIVATARGHAGDRMALISTGFGPHAAPVAVPAAQSAPAIARPPAPPNPMKRS